jgi:hypothetical protein
VAPTQTTVAYLSAVFPTNQSIKLNELKWIKIIYLMTQEQTGLKKRGFYLASCWGYFSYYPAACLRNRKGLPEL